ncbi:response regulator transcription factor [Sciscionella marina]|uniref:response regulator transcription factor n=1 Tax=Sciscionella marina TaxID=508770 RepID=UPI0003646760|nr:response regulator transcription factor [Sciscionella marina]
MRTVLVVDDDATVRDVVRRYLAAAGFSVQVAGDGETALGMLEQGAPDLVVLDVMLPGTSGLEVCKRIRARGQLPVVLLTALGEEEDRIAGLSLGADDYVTKPFSPRELALRVTSVLRRAQTPVREVDQVLRDGSLRLELGSRRAVLGDTQLALTVREFDLLAFFLAHKGTVYSRADLLEQVWGWDFGDQSTVTVHVRRLREKIEADPARPERIATVWGVGYRYDPDEVAS